MTHCKHSRPPMSPSWAEVDLGAIRHNVRALKQVVGPGCGVWAVVKTNAYGHGLEEAARAAAAGGAAGLAVSTFSEGAKLCRAGIHHSILLLCAGDSRRASHIVRLGLVQAICEADTARALSRASQRLGKPARVHLKIDTGMGRLGIRPEEAVPFVQSILRLPGVRLEGVFSHLATAEDNPTYARVQCDRFSKALRSLSAAGIDPGVRHLANSAAALRFPEMRLDGVRAGLLIYGIRPDAPGLAPVDLRPALTWKTRVAFTHSLPAASPVSYGGTYVTHRDSLVGVLPLGYADGYPRQASNRGYVLVQGRPCPVIGKVCMDHTMVDLTPAGRAEVGDEVVLIGRQGEPGITANHLAKWARAVVHEVTTLIAHRVKRVYVDEVA